MSYFLCIGAISIVWDLGNNSILVNSLDCVMEEAVQIDDFRVCYT